jgi:tetratricopeptide (TPR) repeat protein
VSPRIASSALTLGLVLALALQAVDGWQRLQASRLIWQVQREGQELARRGGGSAAVLGRSLEAVRRARALDPVSIEAAAARGDLLLLMGRLEGAEAAYREALQLEPRSEIYFNLGLTLWAAGSQQEALEVFWRAVKIDPRLRGRLPAEVRDRLSTEGREELWRPLFLDDLETGDATAWSERVGCAWGPALVALG